MAKKNLPPPEKIEQARLLYDGGAPIAEILKLLGMSAAQFRTFRNGHGWPLREPACPRKAQPGAPQDASAECDRKRPAARRTPLRPERLIAKLEDAVEREFARAEQALEKHSPKTIESSARTLASLVKTLAELKRMRRDADGAQNDDDGAAADEPPRELAELKAELARRLERLRGGGEAG